MWCRSTLLRCLSRTKRDDTPTPVLCYLTCDSNAYSGSPCVVVCFFHNATLSISAVCNTALGLAHGTIPQNDREYRERHTFTYASEGGRPSSIRASPATRGAVNTRAYKWAGIGCSLGICAGGSKISAASKPNLRSMAPFLHRLVAIDSYYTPSEFGFRKPKRWGPR